jgi:hypothetical protein
MIIYAAPMILWGVAKAVSGSTKASDGTTNLASVILAWGVYALAGVLLLVFARPLASVAARGLDEPRSSPPAA